MKTLLLLWFALLLSLAGRTQSASTGCYSESRITEKMAAEMGYETPRQDTYHATVSQPAASSRTKLSEYAAKTAAYDPDYGKRVRSTVRPSSVPTTKPIHPDDIPCTREGIRTVANAIVRAKAYY